ncbi:MULTISPECIES: putative baseplate assembly protein [Methylomonas]|uniref:putative baseplate assembly protein n=1 Tax=Methylomonas TaxID=416 RepID=UPI0009EF4DA1|nr:putative baseplate assembly protein [Methylomonas koyamae]
MNTISSCGCCSGISVSVPAAIENRPGLPALHYRIGDYHGFLESALARLSTLNLAEPGEAGRYPLQALTSRQPDDFSIALLQAWASLAEVLSFYQERIANEGYLRTATERRSVLELARLIGYQPRPGVAASVFLAYGLDDKFEGPSLIAKGAKVQSLPAPGESPQTFETSDDLEARAAWNTLKPRLSRPQTSLSMFFDPGGPRVYLKGISTKLNVDDPLLIQIGGNEPALLRVGEVLPEPEHDRTLVRLQIGVTPIAAVLNWQDVLNDQYALLLLDDGSGQPGFFDFRFDVDIEQVEADGLTLYSLADGGAWLLQIGAEGHQIVLSRNSRQLGYAVKSVDGIGATGLSYLRISLEGLQDYRQIIAGLTQSPSLQPRNQATLTRNLAGQFFAAPLLDPSAGGGAGGGDTGGNGGELRFRARPLTVDVAARYATQGLNAVADANNAIAKRFSPALRTHLAAATANTRITLDGPVTVYALRGKASPFGHNAQLRQTDFANGNYTLREWQIANPYNTPTTSNTGSVTGAVFHQPTTLYLDADYPLTTGGWIVIAKANGSEIVVRLDKDTLQHRSLAAYGLSGKSLAVSLPSDKAWIGEPTGNNPEPFATVRTTTVHIQSEALALAEEPISTPVCGGDSELLELDRYHEDLQAGRWVIVSGERADLPGTSGVRFSELAMLSSVRQDLYRQTYYSLAGRDGGVDKLEYSLPGDRIHSFVKLAKPLAYCFKRDTVKIHANVVKASHGETRKEVLGSGNGAQALQRFTLKQSPLTFVAANNPAGIDSTLAVSVNGVQWREAEALNGLSATGRAFVTQTDDDGKTSLIFGDGVHGARLPSGVENIQAVYRSGIGKGGNVKAEQINLLLSRPLGVRDVINPLRASGGADPESRDQARINAPLTLAALDRLVSVRDYQDFSRTYAGIGKAYAVELSDGRRQIVHVTVAGAEDIPIDETSDLFLNLWQALHDYGDPFQPMQLAVRELLLIVVSARVRIAPDYRWENVEPALRGVLLEAFGFERRELGQGVCLSEVISAMQGVAGVVYVDVDAFGGVPEKIPDAAAGRRLQTPAEIAEAVQAIAAQTQPAQHLAVNLAKFENGAIRPAQIAVLATEIPETLSLNQIL